MAAKKLFSASLLLKCGPIQQALKTQAASVHRRCTLCLQNRIHTSLQESHESDLNTSSVNAKQSATETAVKPSVPKALVKSQYNDLIDSVKLNTSMGNCDQFTLALNEFVSREKYRRGHVGFIRLAMLRMDEFGLEKDLATYNNILDIFPKGRFAPRRMLDAFWPRSIPQLELALELLTKMEDHGVKPNFVTYDIIRDVFGKSSFPMEKCIRMMYLFEIYKDVDPYRIEGDMPTDPFELSQLTLNRITGKKGEIIQHKICRSDEEASSFVISGFTQHQKDLLHSLEDTEDILLYVEGPHWLWLHSLQQFYYTLRLSKEMVEDPVLGVCMCQPANQKSLMEWMEALQETYPSLSKATVVYNIRTNEERTERKQLLESSSS